MGILAYRRNWITNVPALFGKTWLTIGLTLAVLFYIGGYAHMFYFIKGGGFCLGSLFYSFYDTFMCTGLCIGLIYLFNRFFNSMSPFRKVLASNAFAVYIIHYPIVVILQYALGPVNLFALLKFIIVSVCGIIISFLISWGILKRIPFVRAVL